MSTAAPHPDSFKCRKTLTAGGKTYECFSLPDAEKNGLTGISKLPTSLKVLLENLLRFEDVVATVHFFRSPLERHDCFLWVRDDRRQKMRDAVIERELHALRVDHDEAHLVRAIAVEKGSDERMDGHGLS